MSKTGSLSSCILENDPETQERARWLRGKSLAASLGLEAALLAAILILPLIHPGVLGSRLIVTPLPPFRGGNRLGDEQPRRTHLPSPAPNVTPILCLLCSQPAAVRPQSPRNGGASEDNPPPGDGFDPNGHEIGPLIIGGDPGNRIPIEIKKPEPPPRLAPQPRSEGVMEAALIHKVQPEYPGTARIVHISGTVMLRAIIGTDGRIRELEVINGNAILQASAVAAVRQWRYRPTLLNGEAVEVETLITMNFVLDQQ
jgi:protein TonB